MTSRIAFAVFLLCPLVSGCANLFRLGAGNLANEARLMRDNHRERIRYACLARDAWQNVKAACPTRTYSVPYGRGFQTGFADYLYAGGNGEPLGMPPGRYRHFHAESPRGAEALQDWYEGFRHGARMAKESGLRRFVVISLPTSPPPPLPPSAAPTPDLSSEELNLPAPSSPLPMPRQTPESPPDRGKAPSFSDYQPLGARRSTPSEEQR